MKFMCSISQNILYCYYVVIKNEWHHIRDYYFNEHPPTPDFKCLIYIKFTRYDMMKTPSPYFFHENYDPRALLNNT